MAGGVESWSHYRHLRQNGDPDTQYMLNRLQFYNQLFASVAWSKDEMRKWLRAAKEEQQAFETAKNCIAANKGLVKTFKLDRFWNLYKTIRKPEPSRIFVTQSCYNNKYY